MMRDVEVAFDGLARSAGGPRPPHPTILHALVSAAEHDEQVGIKLLADDPRLPPEHRSYRRLYEQARSMAAALRARGLRPGDPVLLVLPTSLEFVASFFAVQIARGVPVPACSPPILGRGSQAISRLRQIAEASGATLCITDRLLLPRLCELAARKMLRGVVTTEALHAGDTSFGEVCVDAADPALIQYTSGSTGRPRGVLLSHDNLVANVHAIGQVTRVDPGDSALVWLPLYHDMGLIGGLLFSIYWGLPLTLMSPAAFLANPLRWLRAISSERATLSPAPNFAYALCARRAAALRCDELDLSHWRIACNGAEPVDPRTVHAFYDRFRSCGFRAEAMQPVYGLAESSLAVAFPEVATAPSFRQLDRGELAAGRAVAGAGDRALGVASVGRALPGHAVEVVDEHGEQLPERAVGQIVVSGRSVMQGYFRDAGATAAALHGGRLWTGDLGFFWDGELYVVGRAANLIIVRGLNYYAEDLERLAATVDGVRPGGLAVFGVHDESEATDAIVVVCETRVTRSRERLLLADRIGTAINEGSGVPVRHVVLARPGTIPRTPTGKTRRGSCRELYLAGELDRGWPGRLGVPPIIARSAVGRLASKARRLLRRRESV